MAKHTAVVITTHLLRMRRWCKFFVGAGDSVHPVRFSHKFVGADGERSRQRRRSATDAAHPLWVHIGPRSAHRFYENLRRIRRFPTGRCGHRPLQAAVQNRLRSNGCGVAAKAAPPVPAGNPQLEVLLAADRKIPFSIRRGQKRGVELSAASMWTAAGE